MFTITYIVTTPSGTLKTQDKGAAVGRMADARVKGETYTLKTEATKA